MEQQWIEIARTGTFADSAGRPQTFTERDLAAIAAAYDPRKRDAPLVFGHPRTDAAPAFGWAESLKSEGGKLYARFSQVPEQVRDLVARGHYRHVSMSLMPDRVSLRHVALLGAAQPAIDGLRAVEFAAAVARARGCTDGDSIDSDGDDVITVDFSNEESKGVAMTMEELQRQVGQLQAQLEALKTENAALKKKADASKEGKDKAEAAKAAAEQKADKVSADFAAYRGKVENERRETRVADLVKAGKVTPAEKSNVLSFAAKLAETAGTIDFAAPDGKVEQLSLEERYLRDLEARTPDPRCMEFSAEPAHAKMAKAPAYNPAELTALL